MQRVARRVGGLLWVISSSLVGVACGGSSPPAEEPPVRPAPATVEADPEALAPSSDPEASEEQPPSDDERGQTELDAAEDEREASVPQPRKVIYRVTPKGLVVEVEGARFTPKAMVKKLDKGAFGVELEVVAEATDDRTHTLLSPKFGPLSMAAVIYDKKGAEQRRYNDRRDGKDQEFLLPGAPLTLERSWPSGEVQGPLWWGQKVRLEVGLWGLGVDGDEGRPVRKLFVVEMVAGNKSTAVITPPEVPAN